MALGAYGQLSGHVLVFGIIVLADISYGSGNNMSSDSTSNHTGTTTNTTHKFLSKLLDQIDPRIQPINEDGSPVQVQCGFYIMSLCSIDAVSMDYKMSILFREIWMDSRLTYDALTGPPVLSLSSHVEKDIWLPDIYFPNEKDATFHSVTVPNTLIKIYPNGTVIHSVRITLLLSCPMNLASFPMDTQTCAVKIESYAYQTHEVKLVWMSNPVELEEDLELPQFDFGEVTTDTCMKTYKTTGAFSCLRADFTFHRQFGFYLLQTYVPSMLIVILSWVSFWINIDAVPARISLSVTTVLTMTTQLSASTSSIPKVSYPKAIDVWLSGCMFFVFASLIEYAFVNSLSRKYSKEKYKALPGQQTTFPDDTDAAFAKTTLDGFLSMNRWTKCKDRGIARAIDKFSRVVFPVTFVFFNILYWPVYTMHIWK